MTRVHVEAERSTRNVMEHSETKQIKIENRKKQHMAVVVEEVKQATGLAFVMHGLGGHKGQKQIRAVAETFLKHGYTVVTFDTTNTFGESDGSLELATTTNYIEDLEDVINWAKGEVWYKEPFVLVGHSLGGISTILYAEKNPEKVCALAPMSAVVSGKLSIESRPERARLWKEQGFEEKQSTSRPWLKAKIPWSHMEDRCLYDVLPQASKLTMPVLITVGSKDLITPLEHQRMLLEALLGRKEIHVIEGAEHTLTEEAHIQELKDTFDLWINTII